MPHMTSSTLPVVLVHGAWHGGWCFAALQAELDRRGVPSFAVDLPGHGASTLPLTDLSGDAAHVADVVAATRARNGSDVVLAGHSYGGAVITEAAGHGDGVAHLVYLAAFALDAGESVLGFLGAQERHDVALALALRPRDDGSSVIDPDLAPAAFYGECPADTVPAALARLSPQPMSTFGQAITASPRASVASTYVVCRRDEAIHPEHQRVMAARCTHVVELDTDHSPFLSAVAATADVLEAVARR
jgi:pimeloyl-ACP methyl ester carboxylesterase